MSFKGLRCVAVVFLAAVVWLQCGLANAGPCGKNPKMPARFNETLVLTAGLDELGGIHYVFTWGFPEGVEVWQGVPMEWVEYCYCNEAEGLCDDEPVFVPAGGPAHIREDGSECFWVDTDEDEIVDECQDLAAHNSDCQ